MGSIDEAKEAIRMFDGSVSPSLSSLLSVPFLQRKFGLANCPLM